MYNPPTLDTLFGFNMNLAAPALWLVSSVMIILLVDIFIDEEHKRWTSILTLASITIAFIMQLFNLNPVETSTFGGMYTADAFTGFLNIVALGTAFIGVLLSYDYLKTHNIGHGEFYSLLLLSTAGVMFMIGANDLIMIFVALELLSIPLYIMAAFHATDPEHIDRTSGLRAVGTNDVIILRSQESGMKYFILGAFSSAFLVYGFALIYGATGTTSLPIIFERIQTVVAGNMSATVLLLAGTALSLVGLGFKVAAVPFHMWTPDVYEGAPTPVTAFMSVAAKVGGFAALLRLMIVGLSEFSVAGADYAAWTLTIQVLAAATLIVGNFIAISQTNIKRMLAYSSIAHAGYLLMAIAAIGANDGFTGGSLATGAAQAIAVYLLAYMFTNLGAFAVVQAVEDEDGNGSEITDFAGLFKSRPLLAVAMAVFMLSLTGIPLTGGFLGKWLVFGVAVQANLFILAIIGVLTSVVSAFYYMRVIIQMFLEEGDEFETPNATAAIRTAIYASLAGVLITGIAVPLVTNLVQMIDFL